MALSAGSLMQQIRPAILLTPWRQHATSVIVPFLKGTTFDSFLGIHTHTHCTHCAGSHEMNDHDMSPDPHYLGGWPMPRKHTLVITYLALVVSHLHNKIQGEDGRSCLWDFERKRLFLWINRHSTHTSIIIIPPMHFWHACMCP